MYSTNNGTVIIAAISRNRAIGKDGSTPWHISGDLRRFRALTLGHSVVMGRKTWDCIGRPLEGRRNVVISRQPKFSAPGAEIATSVDSALQLVRSCRAFVIGGGAVYEAALPYASHMMITEVDIEAEGDVYFPSIDPASWIEVSRTRDEFPDPEKIRSSFVVYNRLPPAKLCSS